MSDSEELMAQLNARQQQAESAKAHATKNQTLAAVDKLWNLASQIRQELARTNYPTEYQPGLNYRPVPIHGVETPAWLLGTPDDTVYPSGHDHVTHDGRLICYRRERVSGHPALGNSEFEDRVWYPSDEISQGHKEGRDMSQRPLQIKVGLEYMLEVLRRL